MMTMQSGDLIDIVVRGTHNKVFCILDMERKDTKLGVVLLREFGARNLVRMRIELAHKENIELENWSVY